jgi:hypothetical protein
MEKINESPPVHNSILTPTGKPLGISGERGRN